MNSASAELVTLAPGLRPERRFAPLARGQEFLAAQHVIETYTPEKIHEFITSHHTKCKWHLVLQFIAGLLGKKGRNDSQENLKDCDLAFGKCFVVKNETLDLTDDVSLCMIKCLREVDDEDLIVKGAEETAMNDVTSLSYVIRSPSGFHQPAHELASSNWEAVALVCKHMKKLLTRAFYLAYHLINITPS